MSRENYYCKIDGKIYDLKKIRDIMDENPDNPDMARVYVALVEEYNLSEKTKLDLIIERNNFEIPEDYDEELRKFLKQKEEYYSQFAPKKKLSCPRCGSTDVKKLMKIVSPELWAEGMISTSDYVPFRDYRCRMCGYTW